jgi:hypothetical protein
MRPGQFNNNNKNRNRNRNRPRHSGGSSSNNSGGGNPANRVYDSNGPDVKVRGTAQTVAEKYMQLGRDAQLSGDSVMAESYYQHSEHYYRLWLANQPAGQPIQFARRGTEEEFEDENGSEGGDGEDDLAAPDNQLPADGFVPAANADDAGDAGSFNGDSNNQQPNQQRPFRQREYRDGGDGQPLQQREGGQQRDGGQPQQRDGNRERFKSRWGNRNRNGNGTDGQRDGGYRNRDGYADQGERPAEQVAEAVQTTSAPESESSNWEAPSFLTRPVPAVVASADDHVDAPAPVERKPRARKPKVEVSDVPDGDAAK